MTSSKTYRSSIFLLLLIGLIFLLVAYAPWQTSDEGYNLANKQKGAHVFGRLDSTDFQFLRRNHIEWVTIVAWGSQAAYDSPRVGHHNGDSVMMAKSDSSWLSQLMLVRAAGFKIFVKPHVWINAPPDEKWRADIFPNSAANWASWSQSYRNFILRYARLAEQAQAELFCVGMELTRLSIEKPAFWRELIQEVRSVYSGQITYAANWYEEYEQITFWDALDYIGIQAYFPLVDKPFPSVEEISQGWSKYCSSIESIHRQYKRPVIFTEIGYKSTSDSGITPWEWIDYSDDHSRIVSLETQANCYEAFFQSVWTKPWLAGVHLWQLRSDYLKDNSKFNQLDFTPLGKPAEQIIAKGFEPVKK